MLRTRRTKKRNRGKKSPEKFRKKLKSLKSRKSCQRRKEGTNSLPPSHPTAGTRHSGSEYRSSFLPSLRSQVATEPVLQRPQRVAEDWVIDSSRPPAFFPPLLLLFLLQSSAGTVNDRTKSPIHPAYSLALLRQRIARRISDFFVFLRNQRS